MSIEINGYYNHKEIDVNSPIKYYHSIEESTQTPVLIKYIKKRDASKLLIDGLKHEYELSALLSKNGFLNPKKNFENEDSVYVVYEQVEGQPLSLHINEKQFSLHEVLTISVEIITILRKLHKRSIIHRNINPNHLFYNRKTQEITLADLSYSVSFNELDDAVEMNLGQNDNVYYIAPEQTGRMSRKIDYRTDFYSLGVIMYQLLTGRHLFPTTDYTELIYSHIAKAPAPPIVKNPLIPVVISKIIMKLLEKNPENRYQNAAGLKYDLTVCLFQLTDDCKLPDFEIAEHDISENFEISDKVYGRANEISLMNKHFNDAFNGKNNVVFVSGNSGIGKTYLLQQIRTIFNRKPAFVINSAFSTSNDEGGYSVLIYGFKEIIRRIISESKDRLQIYKQKLEKALYPNARLMIDVLPNLEIILGKQPPIEMLEPVEQQRRFSNTFLNFVKVFAEEQYPLVFILDDIHYADISTLDIIKNLIFDKEIKYLFVIGTYRNDSLIRNKPLRRLIDAMEETNVSFKLVELLGIDVSYIRQMLSDSFKSNNRNVDNLAQVIFEKTHGNPFFVVEFLKSLYNEKLIQFNYKKVAWEWNISKIKEQSFTNNVVDLLLKKINQLSDKTLELLKYASCIGNHFNLSTLGLINKHTPIENNQILEEALQLNIIEPYYEKTKKADKQVYSDYRFVHKRVRESVYLLQSERKKREAHYQIGYLLYNKYKEDLLDEHVYDILFHLNNCKEVIYDETEKWLLVELNYKAMKKALLGTAFYKALEYALQAISFLPNDAWIKKYALCLDLYNVASECAFLANEITKMQELIQEIDKRAINQTDKVKVFYLRISEMFAEGKTNDALLFFTQLMRSFNFNISFNPSKISVLKELVLLKWQTLLSSPEEILMSPKIPDDNTKAALQLFTTIGSAVYIGNPLLFAVLTIKCVRQSIEKGLIAESSMGFIGISMLFNSVLKDYKNAKLYAKIALKIAEKFDSKYLSAQVATLQHGLILPWSEPVREQLSGLQRSYDDSFRNGNFEYAALCALQFGYATFFTSNNLDDAAKTLRECSVKIKSLKHNRHLYSNLRVEQSVDFLRKSNTYSEVLSGEFFDENRMLSFYKNNSDQTGFFFLYFTKMLLACLYEEYSTAQDYGILAIKYIKGASNQIFLFLYHTYLGVALLKNYKNTTPDKKKRNLKLFKQLLKELKSWTKSTPFNTQASYYLLMALQAELNNKPQEQILSYYNESIRYASKYQIPQIEVLAKKLYAEFLKTTDKKQQYEAAIKQSYQKCLKWGALGYAGFIAQKYKTLVVQFEDSTVHKFSDELDVKTIFKAAQILTEAIQLQSLLESLIRIAIENAGATKCILILEKNNTMYVEAQSLDNGRIETLQSIPIEKSKDLSLGICNYVIRTKESIVLNNIAEIRDFINDETFIEKNNPKSILALPVMYKGNLIGLLYLENSIATGAFTQQRLEVLKLLSSQISISIENARLYENLEQKVEERTKEVVEKNTKLQNQTREIEKQKNQLEKTNVELEKLSIVASKTDNSIIIFSADGSIVWVNDGFKKLFEYNSIEDYIDLNGKTIYDSSSNEKIKEYVNTTKIEKKSVSYESKTQSKSGRELWVQTTLTPIFDEQGELRQLIAIDTNITQLKQAQNEIQEQKKQLEIAYEKVQETSRLKEIFLANTSHEIRTPLNAIIGFTNLLLNTTKTDELQSKYLNFIKRSSNNLSVIINDILDFSKIEAGKMVFEAINFNIRELILGLVSTLNVKAAEKDIRLLYEIDDQIPEYLVGDPTRLNQILMNLVGNSIKFTNAGGFVKIYMKLKQKIVNNEVPILFKIEDNGIGISKEKINSIFEDFTQAEGHTTRKYGGTGLGLSIVKRLIDMQNGHILVESELNKGSLFSIDLSFKIGKQEATGIAEKTDYELGPCHPKNIKILLVEDNKLNQELAYDTIKEWNKDLHVSIANNGKEAIEYLIENRFDLVLMDMQMPEMDGYEATNYIRNQLSEPVNKIPIIAMTAHAMQKEKEKCLSLGMNDFITKPFNPDLLFSKIKMYTCKNVQSFLRVNKTLTFDNFICDYMHNKIPKQAGIRQNISKEVGVEQKSDFKYFSPKYLKRIYKDNDVKVLKMIDMYLKMVPQEILQLQVAIKNNDRQKMAALAHALKPKMTYLGVDELFEVSKNIEMSVKLTDSNIDKIQQLFSEIENKWQIIEQELQQYKNILQNKHSSIDTDMGNKTEPINEFKPKIIELSQLKKIYAKRPEKMVKMLNMYLEYVPKEIAVISEKYANRQWVELKTAAHSLKPKMLYLGIKELHEIALKIEKSAEKQDETISYLELISTIKSKWEKADIEIKEVIKTIKK